jgi:hypothetical protein
MHTKRSRTDRGRAQDEVAPENFIERIKKARALNCNPSYLGINSFICDKVFNRTHAFSKFL